MSRGPVIIDEDFSRSVALALRERGFALVAAVETPPRGINDDEQLRRAAQMGRILVSHNRRHFVRVAHELRQRGGGHFGVILLPSDRSDERLLLRTAMALDWYASHPDPRPDVVIWNDVQQHLIGGGRIEGYSEADMRLVLGWKPA